MKICIVPIGPVDKDVLLHAQKELKERFIVNVDIGKGFDIPKYAYNKKREQYHSTIILEKMYRLQSPEYSRILGITNVDLFVPELTFVFGEADMSRNVSIISLTRLRQEFYGLPEDIAQFKERIIIEAVHELGHTYGLHHCKNDKCVMFFSNSLDDTDNKGPVYCRVCKRRLNKIRHVKG